MTRAGVALQGQPIGPGHGGCQEEPQGTSRSPERRQQATCAPGTARPGCGLSEGGGLYSVKVPQRALSSRAGVTCDRFSALRFFSRKTTGKVANTEPKGRERERERQAHRQTNRQTGRQTDGQTDRQRAFRKGKCSTSSAPLIPLSSRKPALKKTIALLPRTRRSFSVLPDRRGPPQLRH